MSIKYIKIREFHCTALESLEKSALRTNIECEHAQENWEMAILCVKYRQKLIFT